MRRPCHCPAASSRLQTPTLALLAALLSLLCLCTAATAAGRRAVEVTTPGGIRAWLVEERAIPLVSIRFAFAGGALQDPVGREGLAGLLASLLSEGAGEHGAQDFARRVADQGAQLAITGGRDQIRGGIDALSGRLDASVALLRLALTVPRFDDDAIARVREQRVADLEIALNEPRSIAFNRWHAELFPGHPYGRPVDGTPASMRAISRDDIKAQHRRLLARSALRVVVVGDLDQARMLQALDRIFGELPAEAQAQPIAKVEMRRLIKPVVVEKDQPLSTVAFGGQALASDHADYPALQVLNQVIGSGDFDSTLMEEIRVKRGLAYSVSTSLLGDSAASLVLGGMATKNENVAEALEVLKGVLAKIVSTGPSQEQFDNAKRFLIGSYLLDFDTNAKLADSLLRIWVEGRRPEFVERRNGEIARVTIEDVRRVARQLLSWDGMNVAIVGKPTLPR